MDSTRTARVTTVMANPMLMSHKDPIHEASVTGIVSTMAAKLVTRHPDSSKYIKTGCARTTLMVLRLRYVSIEHARTSAAATHAMTKANWKRSCARVSLFWRDRGNVSGMMDRNSSSLSTTHWQTISRGSKPCGSIPMFRHLSNMAANSRSERRKPFKIL